MDFLDESDKGGKVRFTGVVQREVMEVKEREDDCLVGSWNSGCGSKGHSPFTTELASMKLTDHPPSGYGQCNLFNTAFPFNRFSQFSISKICPTIIASEIATIKELVITLDWWAFRSSTVTLSCTRSLVKLPTETPNSFINNQSNNKRGRRKFVVIKRKVVETYLKSFDDKITQNNPKPMK
ncbi:hypothetical protein EGR_10777 [Echinococcus granulosus]|uniref:Uncharacterized protein n=1 Tax=Echinococcus granulosus TaxID=6210 RepID=W6U7M2_ECHGR|nr:hypothetical protein EGR_10777 [Echinococcus granulosus]EUB54367.1 hypothetical protein EGR_10777 [Echinococcus granulosus]